MKLHQGTYRFGLVIGSRVYKIPRFRYWGAFLGGLLMNIGETLRYRMSGDTSRLCPVLFSLPGGWLVVMPACSPVQLDEMSATERRVFDEVLQIEMRAPNFGRMPDGRIVAIDYPRQSDVVYDREGERDEQSRRAERDALQRAIAAVHEARDAQLEGEEPPQKDIY